MKTTKKKNDVKKKKIKKHYFYKKLRWFMTKLEHKKQEENKMKAMQNLYLVSSQ